MAHHLNRRNIACHSETDFFVPFFRGSLRGILMRSFLTTYAEYVFLWVKSMKNRAGLPDGIFSNQKSQF
jgi:hypothetical protein